MAEIVTARAVKTERDRLYAMLALMQTKRQIESIRVSLAALEQQAAALDHAICRYEHGAPL